MRATTGNIMNRSLLDASSPSRGKIWSFDFQFAAGKVALRWIGDLHPDAGITPNAVFLLLPTPANIRATDGVGFDHLR